MQNVAAGIKVHLLATQNSLPPSKGHLSKANQHIIH